MALRDRLEDWRMRLKEMDEASSAAGGGSGLFRRPPAGGAHHHSMDVDIKLVLNLLKIFSGIFRSCRRIKLHLHMRA